MLGEQQYTYSSNVIHSMLTINDAQRLLISSRFLLMAFSQLHPLLLGRYLEVPDALFQPRALDRNHEEECNDGLHACREFARHSSLALVLT